VSATTSSGALAQTQLNPAGSGSTVTITSDANGNLSQIAFSIATPSTPFTPSFAGSQVSIAPPIDIVTLTNFLNLAMSTGTNSFLTAGGGQGLSYSRYGVWVANDSTSSGRIGFFGYGNTTPVAAMPIGGSASYIGTTIGVQSAPGGVNSALTGNVTITANFGTGTVNTAITPMTALNLATNAVTLTSGLSGTGTIAGNHYSGLLAGGSLNGTSNGTFYGPTAQETTGVWRVSGGGTTAIGSYGAHQ
jgi:hypothetical protein